MLRRQSFSIYLCCFKVLIFIELCFLSLPFFSGTAQYSGLFNTAVNSSESYTYDQALCFAFSPFQTAWPPELTFLFTFLELIYFDSSFGSFKAI